jgi:hypothetical protein
MANDGLRHASKQPPLQSRSPVGADDDQIGAPFPGLVDDAGPGIAFANDGIDGKVRCSNRIRDASRKPIGLVHVLAVDLIQCGTGTCQHEFCGGW